MLLSLVAVNFLWAARLAREASSPETPPSSLRELYEQAEAAFDREDLLAAEKLFNQVLAEAAREQEDTRRAPGENRRAVEEMLAQVLANTHQRLALIAARQGRFEKAAQEFELVSKLQPDFPRIDFNLGLALFHAQRLPEAIGAFARALESDASDETARELLGLAYFEHGDLDAALPNLEKVSVARPDDPQLLLALGTCLARAGRAEDAKKAFGQLFKQHSELAELHLLLGQAAYAQGRTTDAESELQRALALDPAIPQARFYEGIIALDQGNLAKAEQEFEAEIHAHPDDQKARYHLAYVLLEEQERASAIALLEDVLKAAPGYAEAHYSLGKALVEEGKTERGIQELETAARLDPNKAYSHYQLGRAYLKLGRNVEGRRELERAQELKKQEQKTLPRGGAVPRVGAPGG